MEHSIVTVIQARTGSSRLPRKVLMPLAGKASLIRQVERVQQSRLAGLVVVATTDDPSDDVVVDLCREHGVECFRGDQLDLLDRHYQAGRHFGARDVVKIPSDCQLISPAVIDRVLGFYLERRNDFDFVSNLHPATYPDGNDVEVMPFDLLEEAWREADKPHEREHTTPFFWDQPDRFRIGNVAWETGLDYSMTHRWTLDYREDYDFMSAVFDELHAAKPDFDLNDILALLERRPDIMAINSKFAGVNWYRHHLDDLKTVTPDQTNVNES